ncbi:MAG TPA: CopG family transcriptional regulator [Candidatus Hydrogenedentes bacterium]|nr:CopG family transcriptional regulator [Candidatus Hydrogenedentota bacterium]
MAKTVTLRLNEKTYQQFRAIAERENRPLSNFIETAVKRFVESGQYADEFEMKEIRANAPLTQSIKRGVMDAKAGRGRFI